MIVPLDALLRREVERFSLRFTCESCAHLDADAAPPSGSSPPGRCSLGFPHDPHTAAAFGGDAVGFLFCKAFELS